MLVGSTYVSPEDLAFSLPNNICSRFLKKGLPVKGYLMAK